MSAADKDIVERDDDLDRDQDDDDDLEPERTFGVDDVGERRGRVGNHCELAVQRFHALAEFVFVFQTCIEPFQVWPVP